MKKKYTRSLFYVALALFVLLSAQLPSLQAQQMKMDQHLIPLKQGVATTTIQDASLSSRLHVPENPQPSSGSEAAAYAAPSQPSSIKNSPVNDALATSFTTIDFDGNTANTGFYQIPPDPHAATGTNHIVLVVNSTIEWYTKTGTKQYSGSLKNFFTATTSTFDPKVLYDQYNDRFVVVALEKAYSPNTSIIYLAVSDDGDPNGTWHKASFNAKQTISLNECWFDYPGFAIDDEAIYIAGNYFTFSANEYQSSRLVIIPKSPFYAGGSASATIYNSIGLVSGTQTGMQPAHMFGTAQGSVGTFLVSYSGLTDGTNEYLQIIRVDNALSSPTFTLQYINIGDISNFSSFNDAPQLGDAAHPIETNDTRSLNAVWRNNTLWAVATNVPSSGVDAGQTTAHWWKINTSTLAALSLTAQGNVGAEDLGSGTYTFFPSIGVNSSDDAVIGFSASNSSIYAGAYYAVIPAGSTTAGATGTVKTGEGPYYRAFGGTRNRWGDYTSVSIDPTDNSFWVFNEYAKTTGTVLGSYPTESGRWGTAILNVILSVSDPASIAAATASSSQINLTWDGTSPEFRVLRKSGSSSTSTSDGTLVYEGTNKSASVTGLSANSTYFFTVYGKASGSSTYSSGSKKAVSSTQPLPADIHNLAQAGFLAGSTGSTGTFANTGVDATFTGATSTDGYLDVVRHDNTAPGNNGVPLSAKTPSGSTIIPSNISNFVYWTVTNNGLTNFTYSIKLSLSGVPGIGTPQRLCVLKRANSGAAWQDAAASGNITYNAGDPSLTVTGITSFSDFAIASDGGDNPLPVELSAFNGSSTSAGIKLNWTTQSETNNAGFILYRNGVEIASYRNTTALKGQGSKSVATNYAYTDTEAELGITYTYKLRTVDLSGQTHDYIQTVVVKMTEAVSGKNYTYALDQNYPNPFNPTTTIRFSMQQAGIAKLTIYDVLGRAVVSNQLQANKGWNEYNFNASGLGTGMYFYRLSVGGKFDKTMKMALVK